MLSGYMIAAIAAYSSLFAGVCLRRHPRWHQRLMVAGITIDLLIVALLELQRDAVATALAFSLSPPQQLHIGASTVATLMYCPTVWLGLRARSGAGTDAQRRWHKRCGIIAFAFRTIGLMFMFSLLWK